MQTAFQNAKTSVSDIQKVQIFPGKHAPGPPTLLCIKKQFYLTNMQKSITAYQSNVSLKKNNKLSLSFFFFVLPLFFYEGDGGGGGGGSPQLIWDTKEGRLAKFLMKREVIIYYMGYPSNTTSPPPPLKMTGS